MDKVMNFLEVKTNNPSTPPLTYFSMVLLKNSIKFKDKEVLKKFTYEKISKVIPHN